jgi:hypothetical protein
MKKGEGRLVFDFRTALSVDQPEQQAQPFKCTDFVAEEMDATWMIEVTDALKANPQELNRAVKDLLGQLTSGVLMKDMLMKLYGTHAHLANENIKPGSKVFFCVVVGLPQERDNAPQRLRIRDEMKRITDRIGPSFHGAANRPIIKVESIESWNRSHPDVQITSQVGSGGGS